MINRLFTIILLLFTTFCFSDILKPLAVFADGKSAATMPRHTIFINFDLNQSMLIGTSRITLPKNTPLTLECGLLTITGSILERQDSTPIQVETDKDNIIAIPAADTEQTLLLSWTLRADNPYLDDNLISDDGITLAGFWHPIGDQDMLFSLRAALPPHFTGISEGEEITVTETQNSRQFVSTSSIPLRSLHFAAGPYTIRSRELNGVTIYSYFYKEDQQLAPEYLEEAAGYIKRYESLIGPFPYPRYSIVENRLPTGYGMPGFTLLGQAVVRLPFIKDTSLGHEILHSWFGNSVGLAEGSGNWCEGLTSYLADQSYAEDKGEGVEHRKEQILRYEAFVHAGNTMSLNDFSGAGDNRPMARKIRAVGYDKGSMVFHMLRREIGDQAFFLGLSNLYKQKKNKRASWKDLKAAFEAAADKNLDSFFRQWLDRKDIPQLSFQKITMKQEGGQSVIRFRLAQDNEKPYNLLVPVVVHTLTGDVRQVLTLSEPDQLFSITTDSLPTDILLDPDYDVLRHLSDEETPATWNRFLGAQDKTIVIADGDTGAAAYRPLFEVLEKQGAKIKKASEVTNGDLAGGSFLFAGDSPHRNGLFAGLPEKHEGFTLRVRKNPLNHDQTMVLVDSSSPEETGAVLRKLFHYGKYSDLHFSGGKIIDKTIDQTDNGFHLPLISTPSGVPVQTVQDFTTIIDEIGESRVVYVGESHTAYGDHLLQLQILQSLFARDTNIAIGMEMFPRSSQSALDDYIGGTISDEKEFIQKSRYFSVWGFDYRLYRDIIEFAKRHQLPIIGLNLDKKIVSKVFRQGNTDSISEEEQKTIAKERDLNVPGYRDRLQSVHAQHDPSSPSSNFGGFLQAQAMWDETMAESISNYLLAHPERRMVIFAGTGHVYRDSAIPLRVKRRMPKIRQSVLVSDNSLDTGKEQGKQVDYLIFTEPFDLPPEPKIGVVLKEEREIAAEKDSADPKDGDAVKTGRIRVVNISPHGKAGEAGIKEQDVILSVDGMPVHSVADLKIALIDKTPGETVQLKVLRQHALLPDEALEIGVELSSPQAPSMMKPPGHP